MKNPNETGQSKQAKRKQIKDNFPKCISSELQPKVARTQLLLLPQLQGKSQQIDDNKWQASKGAEAEVEATLESFVTFTRLLALPTATNCLPAPAELRLLRLRLLRLLLHDQPKAATSEPELWQRFVVVIF